jgi:6-phosphogluconolactonase
MSNIQVIRHLDAGDLAKRGATRLLDKLIEVQRDRGSVNLCLSGGPTTMRVYSELSRIMTDSPLRPAGLEIWWGDERYVPTTHPDRLAAMMLATLARKFPLDPSKTHPMPGSQGQLDSAAAAEAYARELGDTRFDICVLGIGALGQTASLYPGHPALDITGQRVVAFADGPNPPHERITLTTTGLSNSNQVWFFASGREKAKWVKAALDGDRSLPAARISGIQSTTWLIDRGAAHEMPYFECSL